MNKFWERRSPRERTLAILTGCILVVGASFGVAYRAMGALADLESRIGQLEQELTNLTDQDAQSEIVDAAFQEVASEHSSEWTEHEIHDRLRKEIYRLALRNPPEPGSEGLKRPLRKQDYMIQIPRLREGILNEEGDGYREYQIRIRIPGTGIDNILKFVERLQLSRQLLRIDALDLGRTPQGTAVSATLEVTRTVVDHVPQELKAASHRNLAQNPSFEDWSTEEGRFPDWESEGCALEQNSERATHGSWALGATSKGGDGRIFQALELDAGESYRLIMDVATQAPILLSVRDVAEGSSYGEGQQATGDGKMYRYEFRFLVLGNPGEQREIMAPYIELPKSGDAVFIDNVKLTKGNN